MSLNILAKLRKAFVGTEGLVDAADVDVSASQALPAKLQELGAAIAALQQGNPAALGLLARLNNAHDIAALADLAQIFNPSGTVNQVSLPASYYSEGADWRSGSESYANGLVADETDANYVGYTGSDRGGHRVVAFGADAPPTVDTVLYRDADDIGLVRFLAAGRKLQYNRHEPRHTAAVRHVRALGSDGRIGGYLDVIGTQEQFNRGSPNGNLVQQVLPEQPSGRTWDSSGHVLLHLRISGGPGGDHAAAYTNIQSSSLAYPFVNTPDNFNDGWRVFFDPILPDTSTAIGLEYQIADHPTLAGRHVFNLRVNPSDYARYIDIPSGGYRINIGVGAVSPGHAPQLLRNFTIGVTADETVPAADHWTDFMFTDLNGAAQAAAPLALPAAGAWRLLVEFQPHPIAIGLEPVLWTGNGDIYQANEVDAIYQHIGWFPDLSSFDIRKVEHRTWAYELPHNPHRADAQRYLADRWNDKWVFGLWNLQEVAERQISQEIDFLALPKVQGRVIGREPKRVWPVYTQQDETDGDIPSGKAVGDPAPVINSFNITDIGGASANSNAAGLKHNQRVSGVVLPENYLDYNRVVVTVAEEGTQRGEGGIKTEFLAVGDIARWRVFGNDDMSWDMSERLLAFNSPANSLELGFDAILLVELEP